MMIGGNVKAHVNFGFMRHAPAYLAEQLHQRTLFVVIVQMNNENVIVLKTLNACIAYGIKILKTHPNLF